MPNMSTLGSQQLVTWRVTQTSSHGSRWCQINVFVCGLSLLLMEYLSSNKNCFCNLLITKTLLSCWLTLTKSCLIGWGIKSTIPLIFTLECSWWTWCWSRSSELNAEIWGYKLGYVRARLPRTNDPYLSCPHQEQHTLDEGWRWWRQMMNLKWRKVE